MSSFKQGTFFKKPELPSFSSAAATVLPQRPAFPGQFNRTATDSNSNSFVASSSSPRNDDASISYQGKTFPSRRVSATIFDREAALPKIDHSLSTHVDMSEFLLEVKIKMEWLNFSLKRRLPKEETKIPKQEDPLSPQVLKQMLGEAITSINKWQIALLHNPDTTPAQVTIESRQRVLDLVRELSNPPREVLNNMIARGSRGYALNVLLNDIVTSANKPYLVQHLHEHSQ